MHITDESLVSKAVKTARRWAGSASASRGARTTRLLEIAQQDRETVGLVCEFIDGVIRPESTSVAAKNFASITQSNPSVLPGILGGGLINAAATLPPLTHRFTIGAIRALFRRIVAEIVLDADPDQLAKSVKKLGRGGFPLNLALLSNPTLGHSQAKQNLETTYRLLELDAVTEVSLQISSIVGQRAAFAPTASIERAVTKLRPLVGRAATLGTKITVDVQQHRDLQLSLDVVAALLADPALDAAFTGIVVPTYFPEAMDQLNSLHQLASDRCQRGGKPITVRLVKGADRAVEMARSASRGWANPVLPTEVDAEANFLRALEYCVDPARSPAIRTQLGTHNLFSLAIAWHLARERGTVEALQVELLAGMAPPSLLNALSSDIGSVQLHIPVVAPEQYSTAVSYLLRCLRTDTPDANFVSRITELGHDEVFEIERERFSQAVHHLEATGFAPLESHRSQHRSLDASSSIPHQADTAATPDTDPSIEENQDWARSVLEGLRAGASRVREADISDEKGVKALIVKGRTAHRSWAKTSPDQRAGILHALADQLAKSRSDLIRCLMQETGTTFEQADHQVSQACDLARYYASRIPSLDAIDGAEFRPVALTVVVSPKTSPLTAGIGGLSAALATGSAVILKPALQTLECAQLIVELCHTSGLPAGAVQLASLDDGPLYRALVTDRRVKRVVFTGSTQAAQSLLTWNPEMALMADAPGKNAIVVTDSADLELAVADIVTSAFAYSGQSRCAASLVIFTGQMGRSERFRRLLVDAVESLEVGWPNQPGTQIGPLVEIPNRTLERGLVALGQTESWLLEPRQLDDSGRLWSPGIRDDVVAGSDFHRTVFPGPLVGLMHADGLEEALRWQNATEYGLTAGLHSLDADEITQWLDGVVAGNLTINGATTGVSIARQPYGGWKRSRAGTGFHSAGPNYLFGFGDFRDAPTSEPDHELATPALKELSLLAQEFLDGTDELQWLWDAIDSDETAMREVFSRAEKICDAGAQTTYLRYRPAAITVRVEQLPIEVTLREISAVLAARADLRRVRISVDKAPKRLIQWAKANGLKLVVESAISFDSWTTGTNWDHDGRIRFLAKQRRFVTGSVDVAVFDSPSVRSGRIALLPYLREQSISVTEHRYGTHPRAKLSIEELLDDSRPRHLQS